MTYMEFLRALVEAESEDARMDLVKEKAEEYAPKEASEEDGDVSEEMTNQLEELTAALEEANAQITTLKQEIKDRFFGTYQDEKPEDEIVEPEDVESEEPKEMTLKDLGFGVKDY